MSRAVAPEPRRVRACILRAGVPDRQAAASFDHLVGACEQRRRDSDANRLGGCRVDDKLHLRRKLYWQIARLLAFQNLVYEIGGAAVVLVQIDTIADQAAVLDVLTGSVDRWQPRH